MRRAIEIKFHGATVTHETGGVAHVAIDASSGGGGSGGGGSPLAGTDGSGTVNNVTEINFVNRAAVMDAGGGGVDVVIDPSSGGGGGSNFFNISPEDHTLIPTFDENDEFEKPAGTAIDTAGTRFASAVPWVWGNQGSSTALQTGDGNLILTAPADGLLHGVYQPASVVFKRRGKFCLQNIVKSAADFVGVFAYNSITGHIVAFGPFVTSGPTYTFVILKWTNFTTFSTVGFNALPYWLLSASLFAPLWYEIRSDGTTLTFAVSTTGVDGSFIDVATETIATFLTIIDNAGLAIDTNSASPSPMICDLWRKY